MQIALSVNSTFDDAVPAESTACDDNSLCTISHYIIVLSATLLQYIRSKCCKFVRIIICQKLRYCTQQISRTTCCRFSIFTVFSGSICNTRIALYRISQVQ